MRKLSPILMFATMTLHTGKICGVRIGMYLTTVVHFTFNSAVPEPSTYMMVTKIVDGPGISYFRRLRIKKQKAMLMKVHFLDQFE